MIVNALADTTTPTAQVDEITIPPEGAEGLTLRQLRLMAQADLALHAPGTPTDILALLRRDAARRVGTEVPDAVEGRVVIIRPGHPGRD
jgi:hypothetical protein